MRLPRQHVVPIRRQYLELSLVVRGPQSMERFSPPVGVGVHHRQVAFVLARGNLRSAGGEYHREYSMVFLCSPKPGKF